MIASVQGQLRMTIVVHALVASAVQGDSVDSAEQKPRNEMLSPPEGITTTSDVVRNALGATKQPERDDVRTDTNLGGNTILPVAKEVRFYRHGRLPRKESVEQRE